MKEITRDEWHLKFRFKPNAEPEVDFGDALTYFDNGAVRNSDGDFVVKCDQVEPS